ncbi:hypothetical protein SS50377_27354 [Spironucleus salmonicida]|nr:hypothetical protein SS50377_27354 [Spironucleus salmonicida]
MRFQFSTENESFTKISHNRIDVHSTRPFRCAFTLSLEFTPVVATIFRQTLYFSLGKTCYFYDIIKNDLIQELTLRFDITNIIVNEFYISFATPVNVIVFDHAIQQLLISCSNGSHCLQDERILICTPYSLDCYQSAANPPVKLAAAQYVDMNYNTFVTVSDECRTLAVYEFQGDNVKQICVFRRGSSSAELVSVDFFGDFIAISTDRRTVHIFDINHPGRSVHKIDGSGILGFISDSEIMLLQESETQLISIRHVEGEIQASISAL